MKLQIFTALLLLGAAWTAPTTDNDDEHLTVTKDFYPKELVIYKGKHDIVNIVIPLNSLNFDEDDSSESDSKSSETSELTIFFAEADIDDDGKRTYQGLYVLKDGKAKKILDNGIDAASSGDNSKTVYLAATDGLYTYKAEDQTAVKYGSITDSIKGIAHEAESDVLYILTEDNSVYKVIDEGNKKEKVDGVENAQHIVVDYSNNLYFTTPDKKVHVRTSEGVKAIEGLPENPTKYDLVKPPVIIDDGAVFVADENIYIVYSNGTSEDSGIKVEPKARPTAYGPEVALIQYYGYNKKIYEYNLLAMVLGAILDELKEYLNDKTETIQSLATQKRQNLRKKA